MKVIRLDGALIELHRQSGIGPPSRWLALQLASPRAGSPPDGGSG